MLVHRRDDDLYSITVLTPIFDLRDVVKNEEQCQCEGSYVRVCFVVMFCDGCSGEATANGSFVSSSDTSDSLTTTGSTNRP